MSDEENSTQICSDRLWKTYRGTGVTPHLLESVLMALEEYVLLYVEELTKKEAIAKKILHKINEDDLITLDDIIRV